ncbi:MAG: (2Fe-2S) ferredoxin domain-containing protein [Bacteroidales bacterium]|nr:(2Fe-2S) ferredoxin domain-containing protein [Bacteroidales bacterium]
MLQKNELIICLGSSCFARGNKQMVQIVRQFLEDHKLTHKVVFKGKHCFGNCENGPGIKINDRLYEHIDEDKILVILEKELLK